MIKVSGTINGRQFKTQFIPFYRTCQFESRQLSGESMSMLCPVLSWFGPGPTAFFARALHRLILSIYFGSIVLSWTYQDLSNLATLLARKTTKDTSQIASTCRNQHQPTHTYIYIYPWIARNLLCYNFYQFFSPKKWAKHRRCFQISSARAMEFQMSHTQKGRCHATTDGTLLLEVGKATIFCWVPLGKLRLCEVV